MKFAGSFVGLSTYNLLRRLPALLLGVVVLGLSSFAVGEARAQTPTSIKVVSILRKAPFVNWTTSDRVVYNVTFDHQVFGVGQNSFTISSPHGVTGVIAAVAPVDGGNLASYDVTVSSLSGDGVFWLTVNSSNNGIFDGSGNVCPGFVASQRYTRFASKSSVVSWGDNYEGELGMGKHGPLTFRPSAGYVLRQSGVLEGKTIVEVRANSRYSLLLSSEGKVYSFGGNYSNILGVTGVQNADVAVEVPFPSGVRVLTMAAGQSHGLALGDDGKVYGWGTNVYGCLGRSVNGEIVQTPTALSLPGLEGHGRVVAIAAGSRLTVILTEDRRVFWLGSGYIASGGAAVGSSSYVPVMLNDAVPFTEIDIGKYPNDGDNLYMLSLDGKVYGWGTNAIFRPEPSLEMYTVSEPTLVEPGSNGWGTKRIVSVRGGQGANVALAEDGKVYGWGVPLYWTLGNVGVTQPFQLYAYSPFVALDQGNFGAIGLCADGGALASGGNVLGLLGNGTTSNDAFETRVDLSALPSQSRKLIAVNMGDSHCLAIVSYTANEVPTFSRDNTVISLLRNSEETIDFRDWLRATDHDLGQTLTWTLLSSARYGTFDFQTDTLPSGGSDIVPTGGATIYSYKPGINFVGTDSFTVRVSDGSSFTVRTVSIEVKKKTPPVSWAPPTSVPLNTIVTGNIQNASSGGIAGYFTYLPEHGTVLSTPGPVTLSATFHSLDSEFSDVTLERTIQVDGNLSAFVTIKFENLTAYYTGKVRLPTITLTPNVAYSISYNGSSQDPIDAGTYDVSLVVADPFYRGSARAVFVIKKAPQVLGLSVGGILTPGVPVPVSASSDSGLPVTLSLASGNATLRDGYLTLNDGTSVVLRATQAGDANHEPQVTEFTVGQGIKLRQSINFVPVSGVKTTSAPFTLGVTATSGLPVTLTVTQGPAFVSGQEFTPTGAPGYVEYVASQAGNELYEPAERLVSGFLVERELPSVYFGSFGGSSNAAVAAAVNPRTGLCTVLGMLPVTGEPFILEFQPDSLGAWRGQATVFSASSTSAVEGARSASGAQTGASKSYRMHGTLSASAISGRSDDLGASFAAALSPKSGETASISGFYEAGSLVSAGGSLYAIVNGQGSALCVANSRSISTGALGSVGASGSLSIPLPGSRNLSGTFDSSRAMLSASLKEADAIVEDFQGAVSEVTPSERMLGLSCRMKIVAGNNPLMTGMVVSGTKPKKVIVRALGPKLAGSGIADYLPNPVLRVYNSDGKVIAENDDWISTSELNSTTSAIGLGDLPAGSRDSVVLLTLDPGLYTVHIDSADGRSGVALAEMYDASATPQAEQQHLTAISARGITSSGDGVLIGGFTIVGSQPRTVLVRGLGPRLLNGGVSDALPNPTLRVFDVYGRVVAENDDWETPKDVENFKQGASAAAISDACLRVGAPVLDAGSKDATVLVTLQPGSYTAQISSADAQTGSVLIEIVEVSN